ncbi:MAG: DHA2 family efflux MFS transporter permease subunit [Zymomonas mobilis subsp. pomaceae]|uniref:Drug resistance transporter, EmrB/QacA subfamily n=1 Tax=Zymomonas mobilis subsp. pomaceae (strain ATCC 29192 / DSM 22645 / JCM 10191 / CCUG 17912 / NBRC 13757 / NCIMB 11200 / NRRL B-4491 / Barker I) TaxID=579138 RepID=F8EUJ5_ZYMMT|nr:DHA2 family efflux MFS transporter permease subunit [Zymomonas mobilis]AEI37211.1 drug resistance transporter, EmrB/QacA subfamily [Zymomonas mobilis subsp. pomaceae ATCC 29192]MDX5948581.1 DHA2 family efflux MFS transporter permease subunit [Zymomonas mobilis subsp. pomaceae]GEB88387.1 MFS transporter [Zymomonas mobilis subsp. pomaceae]
MTSLQKNKLTAFFSRFSFGPPNDERLPASAVGILSGRTQLIAGIILAMTNFMVVLDTTIANVSVPHIAGDLAVSNSQGTWVITSYAVAEAICVPLTGWLSRRFGTVLLFFLSIIGFTLFSCLCGFSHSLLTILIFRCCQGFCGGPLMPITQTLLLRVFRKEQHAQAMGLWAMTTITAPIIGPIMGGWLSDNWSWPWIFYINIPIGVSCALGVFALLRGTETQTLKEYIDKGGLSIMIVWIACLQIVLDLGHDHDWFGSNMIVTLAIIAAIGFVVFVIWELTEKEPIVDLRIFRHRGFTISVLSLAFSFGVFFASSVIIPQWLQSIMGYTATNAGFVTAMSGVLAVLFSPIVAKLSSIVDPRILVSGGILWLGGCTALRTLWDTNSSYWIFAIPQFLQGIGMPFFFVPLTTLALASVEPEETTSAAGLMNFLRTLAGAIGTSWSTTLWEDHARAMHNELANILQAPASLVPILQMGGINAQKARAAIDQLVEAQSYALSTTYIFYISSFIFVAASTVIWLAPAPKNKANH